METEITHIHTNFVAVAEPMPLVDLNPPPEQVHQYPALTRDEETFALAIIECGGNISAAYKMAFPDDHDMPLARGKALLAKPAIALKIRDITDAVQEASLVSVGAHLDQLARIRDLSIVTGEMKVAYQAERSRGEAVGIYQKHDTNNKGKGNGTAIQINIVSASPHDKDI